MAEAQRITLSAALALIGRKIEPIRLASVAGRGAWECFTPSADQVAHARSTLEAVARDLEEIQLDFGRGEAEERISQAEGLVALMLAACRGIPAGGDARSLVWHGMRAAAGVLCAIPHGVDLYTLPRATVDAPGCLRGIRVEIDVDREAISHSAEISRMTNGGRHVPGDVPFDSDPSNGGSQA